VNNGLKPKAAHFRHESCVNQQMPRTPGRAEVVLEQAILGLLIGRMAALAAGH
jgi:hypothetical protein